MNKTYGIIILISIYFTAFNMSFSQDGEWIEVRDFETWTSIRAKLELNKAWEISLSEQLRLKKNSTTVDTYFTQFEVGYTGFKQFEFGAGLRYIRDNDDEGTVQGYENHFRYQFDLGYKHKLGRVKLKYRLRYQNKNELGIDQLDGDYPISKFRFKLGIDYNIKNWKLDPKFSVELFHRSEQQTDPGLSRLRFTFGTSYDLKKIGEIKGFYRIERELNPTYIDYPKSTHIIGLSYVYTFKINTK